MKQLLKRKTDSYAERLADKLAWFVDKALIHVGSLPRVVTRFCNGAEGILLEQPGGPGKPPKLRPICMGGLFSKARGYYLNRACGNERDALFDGLQYGVGAKFSMEKMVHKMRLSAELRPRNDHISSYYADAFQNLKRSLILKQVQDKMPALLEAKFSLLREGQLITYVGMAAGSKRWKLKQASCKGHPTARSISAWAFTVSIWS
jgi:hypothetical protein